MTRVHALVIVGCLSVVPILVHAQGDAAAKARLGTWKLNLAKSKVDPASPTTYKSETRVYTDAGAQGTKTSATITDTDGKTSTRTFTAKYDGKDYPYINNPNGDSINITAVDMNTTDAVTKKAGKVVQSSHTVVSDGGKALTITSTGTNASGQKYTNVLVYDKQ